MHASTSNFLPSALFLRGGLAAAFIATSLAGVGFSIRSAHADGAACKALRAALLSNLKTPYHSFAMISFHYGAVAQRQGKVKLPSKQMSETIFTGHAVYVRLLPGKWQPLSVTLAQFKAHVQASAMGFVKCKQLADATVGGVAAAVYTARSSNKSKPVETQVWVSKASGAPLKSETHIDVGGPAGGGLIQERVRTRYEYGNVHAPVMGN